MIVMFSLRNTASKLAVNLASRSSDEEAERADPIAQIHGQVAGGLGDPLPRRMSGRPQDVDPAGLYFDHEQHRTGGVGRSCRGGRSRRPAVRRPGLRRKRQPGGVCLPGCRATAVGAQDAPHGRLAEPIAQTDEFVMYSAIPPPGVFSGEPGDEFADLLVRRRATWPVRVSPPAGHQATVPGQQRGRRDQSVHPQLSRQQPGQRGEDRSIRPRGPWPASLGDAIPRPRAATPAARQRLRTRCAPGPPATGTGTP